MESNVTFSPTAENSSVEQPTTPTKGASDSLAERETVFAVLAALAFVLNLLFVVVMTRKPVMLKSPHNILLFALAITDLLTGIFLPLTPGYVIPTSSFPVPEGLAGEIFCRLLASRYLLFTMGKVSLLKVTCLAIERWYCIFRPITYRYYFTRRRLISYIAAIWVGTLALQIFKFFEWKLSGDKCSKVKAPYGKQGSQALIIIYSLVAFYIPCFISWASFAHITMLFRKSLITRCYGRRQRAQQRMLLRMCAMTCIVLTVCWFPAQTIYILSPFGITKIGSPLHKFGGILAMCNSSINPMVYWLTNREYREGLFDMFRCVKPRYNRRSYDLETQTYSKRFQRAASVKASRIGSSVTSVI